MGIFKKPTRDLGYDVRGGCAAHDMRGPLRRTSEEANADIDAHNKRMHGRDNPNGYLEASPRKKG